nr:MAG: internal scaffolding protein [Microvirus sp.]
MKKRNDPTLTCGPGLTQQQFKDESDVNQIVKKFTETGEFPLAKSQDQFGYAPSQTFTEAMFTVAAATEEFMLLPSAARAHFDNDPALYLDAAADPDQRPVFEELGLLEPLPITPQEERRERRSPPVSDPVAEPPAESPALATK